MEVIAYQNIVFNYEQLFIVTIFDIVKNKGTLLLRKIHIFGKTSYTPDKISHLMIAFEVLDHVELFIKNNFFS